MSDAFYNALCDHQHLEGYEEGYKDGYEAGKRDAASPWHRVEDDPPDENKEAIFYYELTGISGTVYKNISIIYLCVLISLGYRPISWMEKPEPPKEGA